MAWNKKVSKGIGVVFYRGSICPEPHEFEYLHKSGIVLTAADPAPGEAWARNLSHPVWGKARLSAPIQSAPIPKVVLKYDNRLDDSERELAALGRSSVRVEVAGEKGDVLRDRKRLLRFLNAAMGGDGLIALDMAAMRFWSRDALADELSHDADLDIDSLFTVHAVTSGESKTVHWYHTHGLAEIGFFDFDILRPSKDLLTSRCHDFARAMAFAIVEEKVSRSTPMAKVFSGGLIQLAEVSEFNRRALKIDRELRDSDEAHNQNRAVLCDPIQPRWFHRIIPPKLLPSRLLSSPQGEFMVYFPSAASRLMEERARQTYGLFRLLRDEFADLQVKPIVKLGYQIDGGEPNDREHMWFEVHALEEQSIDATLVNVPRRISAMKQGDRRRHSLDRLTDWALIGPTGSINPRDTRPARTARRDREKILRLLEQRSQSKA
jgi:hypothetical protein